MVEQNTRKKRIPYLDYLKAFCLLIIIFQHVNPTLEGPIATWLGNFKIVGFYFVTGLLVSYLNKETTTKKLFQQIMVPYFIFSGIVLVFQLVNGLLHQANLLDVLKDNLILIISFQGIGTLWFLPSFFLGRWLFEKLKSVFEKVFGIVLGIFLAYLTARIYRSGLFTTYNFFFSLVFKTSLAVAFMGIGSFVGTITIQEKSWRKWLYIIINLGIGFWLSFDNLNLDLNNQTMGNNMWFFLFGATFSLAGFLGLFKALSELISKEITSLSYISYHSLEYMVIHLFFWILPVSRKIGSFLPRAPFQWWLSFFLALVFTTIAVYLYNLVKKNFRRY